MGLLFSRIKKFKYTRLNNEDIYYENYKIVSSRIKTRLSYSVYIQYKKYKYQYTHTDIDRYTIYQYKENDIILKIKDKRNKIIYNILLSKHNVLPKFNKIQYSYENKHLYLKFTLLYYSGRVKVYFDYELLLKLISESEYNTLIYYSDFFVE
jgi:hypothetical protein